MAEQRNREGQQLGNYRLERLLGRGGFAEVYLGHHLRLGRPAAIKVLHAYLAEKEVDTFQQEAQVIASLDHPQILRIFDFDVQHGVPFLVMDYLPNGTLRQRHRRGEQVPLPTVVAYVKQVAEALHYAHEQRLIHRDVKPENLLIGRRNEVVLSDFGIAAIAHSTSSMTAQASMGTVPYMAPEQIQEHPRPASDQYALGIIVYEWLSGELPFTGSFTEIFAKHLMTLPPPLRQKVPALSAEVEQVVLTALEKEPRQRFGSIQAFATALEQASQVPQQPAGVAVEEAVFPQPPSPHPSSPLPPAMLAAPARATPTDFETPPEQTLEPAVAAPSPAPIPPSIASMPRSSGSSSSPRLFHLSGWALVVSGVVALVGGYLNVVLYFSRTALNNPWWRVDELFVVTLLVLSSLGLAGLQANQSNRARPIGPIGLLLLLPGNLGLAVYYILLFSPAIYPQIVSYGHYSALFNVSLLLSLVGTMLVGLAMVRAGIFPRWAALVLILSQVARVVYLTPLAAVPGRASEVIVSAGVLTVVSVALAGCGFALFPRQKVLAV
jgi:serine/threonine protein kinase